MRLSRYARNEWLTILAIGAMLLAAAALMQWWLAAGIVVLATLALVAFFRDPERSIPTQRGIMVAPADGKVSSVHELEHFEPLDGPATCIRIFLSVLDVHVNRSPCHAAVAGITQKPGEYRNALNPDSAEANAATLAVLVHPVRRHPIAAVRQVAGMLARTIVCDLREDQVVQRGQRIGMIKLGSTTELYIPAALSPQVQVRVGEKVYGGQTVLARINSVEPTSAEAAGDSTEAQADETTAPTA